MIAPKGGPHRARRVQKGGGVPCLIASIRTPPAMQDHRAGLRFRPSAAVARASSRPISARNAETDLFGEQVVLCAGLVELIRAGFETLVEAATPPRWPISSACTK